VAKFLREDEARNFVEQLRSRHNAQDIPLLDAEGLQVIGD
jgi:hypothetical protein